jgi:FeS assembly SUF system protein
MTQEKELKDFLPENNGAYFRDFEIENKASLISKEQIIECIRSVMDPEIPVNLYDLGLIYSIKIDDNHVIIEMTLTNPNCPVAGQMPKNVGKSIEQIEGLKSIQVKMVWEPKWTKELMSEDAKLALDIF